MRFTKLNFFMLTLLLTVATAPLLAQTAPLNQKQQAVIAFDLRLEQMMASELATTLGLANQLSGLAAQAGEDGMDPNKIKRVFGVTSAPENMAAGQEAAMNGTSPVDFFVNLEFRDAAGATEAMEKIMAKDPEKIEHNGKTYYAPPSDGQALEGMLVHQLNETTIQTGTETYLHQPNQTEVFSAGLKSAWQTVPDTQALRIAIDLEGAKDLVAEAVEGGKQNADMMTQGMLDLVPKMKNLRLSMDLSGSNLLTVQTASYDSEQTEELKMGVDGLLGASTIPLKGMVNQMKQQDPDTAAVLESLVNSLKAKADGNEISITIPRPEGFEAAIKKLLPPMGGAPGF